MVSKVVILSSFRGTAFSIY